jgi:hypothetical protein
MAVDNPWFLITLHEVEEIQIRLESLEKELPGIRCHHFREITGILHEVQERRQ